MPGLLQTEACARAVMRLRHLRESTDDVERRVALRMARQEFLTQPGAPDLWVALDESALRRPFGSRDVQRAQLQHLIEMVQLSNITLQVLPFHIGGHAAAGGPFTILRFFEPSLPDVVYLEHLTNALYLDKNRDTTDYLMIMDSLCVQAESPAGSMSLLHRILKET